MLDPGLDPRSEKKIVKGKTGEISIKSEFSQ